MARHEQHLLSAALPLEQTMSGGALAPDRDDIEEATRSIAGLVHRTPLLSSRAASERAGVEVWLKAENLQKTGSFKARGAFNKVIHLTPAERAKGIVTASAGNHGQAVAFVARHFSIPGYVVMPEGANRSKVAAVRGYGAEAILHGRAWDDAYARSLELAEEKGLTYVHPFKDRHVMAGQATIALEILEDLPDVEAVLVPIGGGGLISGIATALAIHKPSVRVIGIEAEGAANMTRSREQGRPVELASVDTIADGLATRRTDSEVFEIVERVVHELTTVTDDEIRDAIRFLLERAKLMAETGGAAAVAALLSGRVSLPPGTRTVALVCGGNFDVAGKLTLDV
jgi:threonine dehydratase